MNEYREEKIIQYYNEMKEENKENLDYKKTRRRHRKEYGEYEECPQ